MNDNFVVTRADAPDVDLETGLFNALVPVSHIRTTLDSESIQEEAIFMNRQSIDLSSDDSYRQYIMGFLLQSHGTPSSLDDNDSSNDNAVHLTPVQDLYDVYDPDAPFPGFPSPSRRLRDSFSDLFFVPKPKPDPRFVSIPRTASLSPAAIDNRNRRRRYYPPFPVQQQLRPWLLKRNVEWLIQPKAQHQRRER